MTSELAFARVEALAQAEPEWHRLIEFVQSLKTKTSRAADNNKRVCFLCDSTVGEPNWTTHIMGHRHTKNQQLFEYMQRIVVDIYGFQSLVPRIERLTKPVWRDACYATFMRALLKNRNLPRQQAEIALVKMEDLHHLFLLELAAWKVICTVHAPTPALRSYTSAVIWASEGWKGNKTHFYRSNEVVTIVRCVLPFLDQRSKLEHASNQTE